MSFYAQLISYTPEPTFTIWLPRDVTKRMSFIARFGQPSKKIWHWWERPQKKAALRRKAKQPTQPKSKKQQLREAIANLRYETKHKYNKIDGNSAQQTLNELFDGKIVVERGFIYGFGLKIKMPPEWGRPHKTKYGKKYEKGLSPVACDLNGHGVCDRSGPNKRFWKRHVGKARRRVGKQEIQDQLDDMHADQLAEQDELDHQMYLDALYCDVEERVWQEELLLELFDSEPAPFGSSMFVARDSFDDYSFDDDSFDDDWFDDDWFDDDSFDGVTYDLSRPEYHRTYEEFLGSFGCTIATEPEPEIFEQIQRMDYLADVRNKQEPPSEGTLEAIWTRHEWESFTEERERAARMRKEIAQFEDGDDDEHDYWFWVEQEAQEAQEEKLKINQEHFNRKSKYREP